MFILYSIMKIQGWVTYVDRNKKEDKERAVFNTVLSIFYL